MSGLGLGKCNICGHEAQVQYPLLAGTPSFCHSHHNERDAGRFGCDFSGHDDFDIPDDLDDPFKNEIHYRLPHRPPQRLDRRTFVWTDINGVKHPLRDVNDRYLSNIINFLKRGEGHTSSEEGRRARVIKFLEKEQRIRANTEVIK